MKAKVTFKPDNQNDFLIFPLSLGELIPETDPVRILNGIVDRLDISDIEATYPGGGASSFHPRMMLKVIIYGYMNNIYSGRQLERAMARDINYMWLSGMSRPDFRTLNLFRSRRLSKKRFDGLFAQVVGLMYDEGLVSLETQYIDGTKIESCANRYTFVWRGTTEKNRAKLEERVRGVLAEAERVVGMEEADYPELPMTAEEFGEKADSILRRMDEEGLDDRETRKAVKKVRDEQSPKLKEYDRKLETLGERNSYSKTDPDATFMRMKEDHMMNGQLKPGYNVQISTENQFVTHYGIYSRPGDQGTLISFLESFAEMYGGLPAEVVADSGYGSEMNYEYMVTHGIAPYVKYNMFQIEGTDKYRDNPFLPANMYHNADGDYYVCPAGQHLDYVGTRTETSDLGYEGHASIYKAKDCRSCPMRSKCCRGRADRRAIEVNHDLNHLKSIARELLTSARGVEHRRRRGVEAESVFGDIKFNHEFRRFKMKSEPKVHVEFGLVALAHNLRKYTEIVRKRMEKASDEALVGRNLSDLLPAMAA